ncbi:TPA: ogr/Delta-like zinc finger family protein [Raoultella ornithinolytica]
MAPSLTPCGGEFMFTCPHCGHAAHTRTSRRLSDFTVRQYHQCQNLECSAAFITLNAYEGLIPQRRRKDIAAGEAPQKAAAPDKPGGGRAFRPGADPEAIP